MVTRPPSICLTMIVKNEAHVIARCLQSVRPLINSWVVVDTGSTDGTQQLIRETMKDLPGELHERPWKDFASNRNEAIALARGKGDYLLVIDADDLLVFAPHFTLPPLTADTYALLVTDAGTHYWRTHLFRSDAGLHYVGVLHEVIIGGTGEAATRLSGVSYRRTSDGARSADPDKFRKDAAVLAAALDQEPGNARYAFYLAQSWRDAGELEKARAVYERRASMGGWAEEVWYSLFQAARLTLRLGRPAAEIIADFLRAYENRPARAESLCQLAGYLREQGRPAAAYPFAKIASETTLPPDILFLDEAVYSWRALDELAVAAYWTDHHSEAVAAAERLLAGNSLPPGERARVEKNMGLSRAKLSK